MGLSGALSHQGALFASPPLVAVGTAYPPPRLHAVACRLQAERGRHRATGAETRAVVWCSLGWIRPKCRASAVHRRVPPPGRGAVAASLTRSLILRVYARREMWVRGLALRSLRPRRPRGWQIKK